MEFKISPQKKRALQRKVLSNYEQKHRELPWRETTDPYRVLLSEFMAQQTQVSRVIDYYHKFLKQYPDIKSLAKARKKKLLSLWNGLGYNNRALRLLMTAKIIMKKHDGDVPHKYLDLIALPGIGDYIASAIMAFAYNLRVPVIDTNIQKALLFEFQLPADTPLSLLKAIDRQLIPRGKSRLWHNALMEYGANLSREIKMKYPSNKQKAFQGSRRQARGQLVKYLIRNHSLKCKDAIVIFNHPEIEQIIEALIKEGMIRNERGILKI